MDNWYSYTLYPTHPPRRRQQLPTEPLCRSPGSQKSSSSSDTGFRNEEPSKTEKHRRFLFARRRKKRRDLPKISFESTADRSEDVTTEGTFKAIAYSECEKSTYNYTTNKPSSFSQTTESRISQSPDCEPGQRRHSDSSYQSTRTFTPEQFKYPILSEEQCSSPISPQRSIFSQASSEATVEDACLEITPNPTPPLTEETQLLLKDHRRSQFSRPLSSDSNTLGEVEPSTPTHLEKKFPARIRINPLRVMHTRSKSDQSEVFGSWEEAVDWWYEYGEDGAGWEKFPGGFI
jgi:hypothetical protein